MSARKMPGPQWLYGFGMSEQERLTFFRVYVAFSNSVRGNIHDQNAIVLDRFLERCESAGLRLLIPRAAAIDVLKRPEIFSWAPVPRRTPYKAGSGPLIASTHAVLERSRDRLRRSALQLKERGR